MWYVDLFMTQDYKFTSKTVASLKYLTVHDNFDYLRELVNLHIYISL